METLKFCILIVAAIAGILFVIWLCLRFPCKQSEQETLPENWERLLSTSVFYAIYYYRDMPQSDLQREMIQRMVIANFKKKLKKKCGQK